MRLVCEQDIASFCSSSSVMVRVVCCRVCVTKILCGYGFEQCLINLAIGSKRTFKICVLIVSDVVHVFIDDVPEI